MDYAHMSASMDECVSLFCLAEGVWELYSADETGNTTLRFTFATMLGLWEASMHCSGSRECSLGWHPRPE